MFIPPELQFWHFPMSPNKFSKIFEWKKHQKKSLSGILFSPAILIFLALLDSGVAVPSVAFLLILALPGAQGVLELVPGTGSGRLGLLRLDLLHSLFSAFLFICWFPRNSFLDLGALFCLLAMLFYVYFNKNNWNLELFQSYWENSFTLKEQPEQTGKTGALVPCVPLLTEAFTTG